ncbi:MAG: hypothetical protein ACKVQT_30240 [Burkholderiales bacterium]
MAIIDHGKNERRFARLAPDELPPLTAGVTWLLHAFMAAGVFLQGFHRAPTRPGDFDH